MTVRAIFFDFDGVIVESVDIKTRAFERLFASETEALPAIVQLHVGNGGMSRFEKFEKIYEDILRRPLSPQESARLGSRFSELVVNEVVACEEVPGALEFLRARAAELPLFLVSATPEEEVEEIVERRKLAGYFREVHGSPRTKVEIVRDVLERHDWSPGDVVFVGDALNDYDAAREVGLRFIGRVPPAEPSVFPSSVETVRDLAELEAIWPKVLQATPASSR